jgi:hypothetical protein
MSRKAMAKCLGKREEMQMLGNQLKDSLKEDRKQQYSATAKDLEEKLDEGDISKGAFTHAQKWCRQRNEVWKPTIKDEEDTQKEFEELHMAVELKGNPIPVHVSFDINDNLPDEQEVKRNLKGMHSGKSGGPTEICVEHIKEWMRGAKDEKNPRYQDEWRMVLDIVEYCFMNNAVDMPRAFEIGILALIPKDVTSYRGICLLETVYKLVSAIIANRLSEKVQFHDAINGFCKGRGMGTATTEIKLQMQHTRNLWCREPVPDLLRPEEGILLAQSGENFGDIQGIWSRSEYPGIY